MYKINLVWLETYAFTYQSVSGLRTQALICASLLVSYQYVKHAETGKAVAADTHLEDVLVAVQRLRGQPFDLTGPAHRM